MNIKMARWNQKVYVSSYSSICNKMCGMINCIPIIIISGKKYRGKFHFLTRISLRYLNSREWYAKIWYLICYDVTWLLAEEWLWTKRFIWFKITLSFCSLCSVDIIIMISHMLEGCSVYVSHTKPALDISTLNHGRRPALSNAVRM